MSNSGFDYLIKTNLSNNDKLKIYYDFDSGSYFDLGQAGNFTGYLFNKYPSSNSGDNNLRVLKATGTTQNISFQNMSNNFLMGGDSGNLSYSPAYISGQPSLNYNNCTFLFSEKMTQRNGGGIIFGSLEKTTGIENGVTYSDSKGYNFGINDRNQLFFNGVGPNGEYVLVANEIELANKNICSISVGQDSVNFAKYDLASSSIEEQSFSIQTNYIKNATGLIGFVRGSDVYYPSNNGFSGVVDRFAWFSGVIDNSICLSLASGFAFDLQYNQGSITAQTNITGQTNQTLFATGVTGVKVIITGSFLNKRSGILKNFGSNLTLGSGIEGELYFTGIQFGQGFLDTYLEKEGYIVDDFSYDPTGENAYATLGLNNVSGSILTGSHSISFTSPETTGIANFFASGITGFLKNKPTGVNTINLTQTFYITGEPTKGLIMETGRMKEYKYDLLYYLGHR